METDNSWKAFPSFLHRPHLHHPRVPTHCIRILVSPAATLIGVPERTSAARREQHTTGRTGSGWRRRLLGLLRKRFRLSSASAVPPIIYPSHQRRHRSCLKLHSLIYSAAPLGSGGTDNVCVCVCRWAVLTLRDGFGRRWWLRERDGRENLPLANDFSLQRQQQHWLHSCCCCCGRISVFRLPSGLDGKVMACQE